LEVSATEKPEGDEVKWVETGQMPRGGFLLAGGLFRVLGCWKDEKNTTCDNPNSP